MKVILTKDVPKIGKKDEVKEVNQGYATNFLIPRKMAIAATPGALKNAQKRAQERDAHAAVAEELIEQTFEQLNKKKVTLSEKTNDKGSLFQQVHTDEVIAAIKEQLSLVIDPSWLVFDEPIKAVGEYPITCKHQKHTATVIVEVVAA